MGNDDVSSIQQPLAASFSLEAMHMHLQSGWHISLAQHCTWVCMQCRYVCTHAWCSMTLLCCRPAISASADALISCKV